LKIAFDKPLDAEAVRALPKTARIESGRYVAAADRFETIRPGYQVVYDQLAAPRHAHEILSSALSPDRRTLTLVTRPRVTAVNYAVTLPRSHKSGGSEIDLAADLSGVEARWESVDGKESWSGWLPHVDLQVARELIRSSAEHEQLFAMLGKRGTLTLRGQLDLNLMLQPAIQPGAKIDWERPTEDVMVRFDSSREFKLRIDERTRASERRGDGFAAALGLHAAGQRWHQFEIAMETGESDIKFTPWWCTSEDSRPRAFPLRRFLMPWAQPPDASPSPATERAIPEIAGGNWLHGRRLYFSEQFACAKCHTIRGEGARIGPDLSNLIHRDYASVRKDIQFPNAAMNPDHVTSVIERTDGETMNGIIQRESEGVVQLAMAGGVIERLPRAKVKSIKPSTTSLMPDGLWDAMTDQQRRDLMSFVLTVPLEPFAADPIIQGHQMPTPRTRADVEKALGSAAFTPLHHGNDEATLKRTEVRAPFRIVLCAHRKIPATISPAFTIIRSGASAGRSCCRSRTRESRNCRSLAERGTMEARDLIAFFSDNPGWAAEKAPDLDAFLARGGGLVFLHWAVNGGKDADVFAQRIGLAWGAGARFRHGVEDLAIQPHEITKGLPSKLSFVDETYWKLRPGGAVTVLASSMEDGEAQPQVWIREQGPGRVFACIPGHFTWTFDDPLFRVLLLRGMAWSAHQPLDRFNELVTVGARIGD
jgi:putative heme-binding domain-containing protein